MGSSFIFLFGLVSLFADMTYEGARSIGGAYLALLGANGFIVGVTAGLGELLGYSFRIVSGYLSDKTQKYWPLIFIGYFINLVAVPLLALAGSWQTAALLIVLERFGKAIRTPPRDALVSFASFQMGRGSGFGLLEGLDQIGAVLGPLIVSGMLYYTGSFQWSFAVLVIPAILSFVALGYTQKKHPKPQEMEVEGGPEKLGWEQEFSTYLVCLSLFGAGFVDFSLVSFHFKQSSLFSDASIPLMYALAMFLSGLSSLIFGKLYDMWGLIFFVPAIFLSALSPFLLFLGNATFATAGIFCWSAGLGAVESIMLAYVADLVPKRKRARAFGYLYLSFGISWFLGSALLGWLYDYSIAAMVVVSSLIQIWSIGLMRNLFYAKTP